MHRVHNKEWQLLHEDFWSTLFRFSPTLIRRERNFQHKTPLSQLVTQMTFIPVQLDVREARGPFFKISRTLVQNNM